MIDGHFRLALVLAAQPDPMSRFSTPGVNLLHRLEDPLMNLQAVIGQVT